MRGLHLQLALKPTRRSIVLLAFLAVLLACAGAGAIVAAPSAAGALTGPSVTVNAGGLVLTMRTASGPYFLRELLPVSVSLTNHTSATVRVYGFDDAASAYGGAFNVTQNGGGKPTYEVPVAPLYGGLNLGVGGGPGLLLTLDKLPVIEPGETLTAPNLLLPLTASGRVTLTGPVRVASIIALPGGGTKITGLEPFAGREPTLALTVAPSAPPDRTLSLWRHTTRVVVYGPAGALFHLRYMFTASAGDCYTGSSGWELLKIPVADAHSCSGHSGTWSYAIGAPGYAISSETLLTF